MRQSFHRAFYVGAPSVLHSARRLDARGSRTGSGGGEGELSRTLFDFIGTIKDQDANLSFDNDEWFPNCTYQTIYNMHKHTEIYKWGTVSVNGLLQAILKREHLMLDF